MFKKLDLGDDWVSVKPNQTQYANEQYNLNMPSEKDVISINGNIYFYKHKVPVNGFDYYMLEISMEHSRLRFIDSITGTEGPFMGGVSSSRPAWDLKVDLRGSGVIYQSQPESTHDSKQVDIGFHVDGSAEGPEAGISISESFTIPDISIVRQGISDYSNRFTCNFPNEDSNVQSGCQWMSYLLIKAQAGTPVKLQVNCEFNYHLLEWPAFSPVGLPIGMSHKLFNQYVES